MIPSWLYERPVSDSTKQEHGMDKKTKKKIDVLRQRLTKLRPLLAGAKKQPDDPDEIVRLEEQIASIEAEIEKLKQG